MHKLMCYYELRNLPYSSQVSLFNPYIFFEHHVKCSHLMLLHNYITEMSCFDFRFQTTSKVVGVYLYLYLPTVEQPSCLQITFASGESKKSSQTVPHWLSQQISTLPSFATDPFTRRISPSLQQTGVVAEADRVSNNYNFDLMVMVFFSPTWTLNTSIIIMATKGICNSNPTMRTVQQATFTSSATKRIQPDWTTSIAKLCTGICNCTWKRRSIKSCTFNNGVQCNIMYSPMGGYPSCLHTTAASLLSQ